MSEIIRKKLIGVALPLEAINEASAREKSIRHGHPSTLHLWWARRPLSAARAVIFSQMVNDPSSHPELFPTEKDQEKERQRLFRIIEELVIWENATNENVLKQAREEIWKSWRITCEDNKNHPRAKELFNPAKLPAFHDPFAGGGALPLEAQRLGLESYASDLNPVAVLINRSMIEIPPKYADQPPVNPDFRKNQAMLTWKGAQGLAEDVRYYGQWIRDEAEKRIGYLYPKVDITKEMAKERPDLNKYIGKKLTVIAWIWARTVKSPNPAFRHIEVPLISTFMLSTKPSKEVYIQPIIESGRYSFVVKVGKPKDVEGSKSGTKLARGANFRCIMSGSPMAGDYIKGEGKAGRMGKRLMAIVVAGESKRIYLSPTIEQEKIAQQAKPEWKPEVAISGSTQYLGIKPYGMERFDQLFTERQLVALTTFSDLVKEARDRIKQDAMAVKLNNEQATEYGNAVATYLGFLIDQQTNQLSTCCGWNNINQQMIVTFSMQALQMKWDFAECNLFSSSTGSFINLLERQVKGIASLASGTASGRALQMDATSINFENPRVISTDPPYYDNVPYADLSDFFYVWLRHSLRSVIPEMFTTLVVPKTEELVAFAYRHGSKEKAEDFFLDGMTKAMHCLYKHTHPAFPVTIFYAFRQAENDENEGRSSTGWETFLESVVRAGFSVSGTWPIKTESANKLKAEKNALASSIVLVCRPRSNNAVITTRREFITALKNELPKALAYLQRGNIAPVDLAQAAIGPGMAIFTRYSKILEADGSAMKVRAALSLINQTLDEALAEQEGEFDSDTRWALTWFEQNGMDEGSFGDADNLSKAKNTAVNGLVDAGIIVARSGKVRLLKRGELSEAWDPVTDKRLTAWEATQHLIHSLEEEKGEQGAAELLRKLGGFGDAARDLAYRLFNICEKKKWSQESLAYNSLILAWPEITKLAQGILLVKPVEAEATLFDQ